MSMIGKTLGTFECTALLGKGGMGEVYKAKDQKLGRDVAIKVLPKEFAKDIDRVARFQREAKLLASLNHNNIASIYGLEESEGTHFLVLELVEGNTLADRIKSGPIPMEESLKLSLQIAEALEAAHENGVIHRDLKPANIKVTPDGKVKVLDFGLAKAFAGDQGDMNLSNSPTLSAAATQQGVILGTAAYMSPEQARGETVDKKADIWAFGVVLFEMLTGRATFEGRSVSDVLASVLKIEPDWNRLPPNLHPRIRFVLERCLEKEPKDRCSGIGDARADIQKALADPSFVFTQPTSAGEARVSMRKILPWFVAALVLGEIIVGVAVWKLKPAPPPEPKQVTRFEFELPRDQQFSNLPWRALAVSPDGRQFVYSTPKGLYSRFAGEFTAKLISETGDSPQQPFFSPDGKWIGYLSTTDRKLKKIAVNGGAPVPLCDVSQITAARWCSDDTIVYGQFVDGRIMQISANGGEPKLLIKSESGSVMGSPEITQDGKSIIYTSQTETGQSILTWHSLESGERRELFEGSNGKYVPTGHIVYGLGNSLFAVPFDLNGMQVTGAHVPVVEGVANLRGVTNYAVSDSGTLIYIPWLEGTTEFERTLVWVDRSGKEESAGAPPKAYCDPRISPDGTRAALTIVNSSNLDIWIWNFVRNTLTPLTFDPVTDRFPLWTPDGKRIVFHSDRNYGIYQKAADGTGKDEPIGSVPEQEILPWALSGDGKTLVVTVSGYASLVDADIGILSMDGDPKYSPLLKEKYSEAQPRLSPDGRWMAYTSNESGSNEVYVRPFPDVDSGGRWQVSTLGGDSPIWSPTGRELFYRNGDVVMAVPYKTEKDFSPGTPTTLFSNAYTSIGVGGSPDLSTWDISPDGNRFLMMKDTESAAEIPRKINIVLNWFEELEDRVPAD